MVLNRWVASGGDNKVCSCCETSCSEQRRKRRLAADAGTVSISNTTLRLLMKPERRATRGMLFDISGSSKKHFHPTCVWRACQKLSHKAIFVSFCTFRIARRLCVTGLKPVSEVAKPSQSCYKYRREIIIRPADTLLFGPHALHASLEG